MFLRREREDRSASVERIFSLVQLVRDEVIGLKKCSNWEGRTDTASTCIALEVILLIRRVAEKFKLLFIRSIYLVVLAVKCASKILEVPLKEAEEVSETVLLQNDIF